MDKYRIGQVLVSKEDMTLETALLHRKVKIKKGSKVIIGADKLGHHFSDEIMQPLPKDAVVENYSANGIAEWIMHDLMNRSAIPMKEMLEEFEIDADSVRYEIAEALWELGFTGDMDEDEDEDVGEDEEVDE